MTTSHAGSASASDGDGPKTQQKANSVNQHSDSDVNGSDRAFGLDGTSGRPYRPLSRSPSPYRRKPSRSPSPYRNRSRRSPSPYRARRALDRSPSPYRHGRSGRGYDTNDSRSYHKRKASPPRGSRPDKRPYTDRGRGENMPPYPRAFNERREVSQRSYIKPISYAELDHSKAVPDFRNGIPTNDRYHKSSNGGSQHDRPRHASSRGDNGSQVSDAKPKEREDVIMKSPTHDVDYTAAPVEETEPSEESREEKRRRWKAKRATMDQPKNSQSLLQKAVLTNASEADTPDTASPAPFTETSISPFPSPRNGDFDSQPASPDVMVIDKQDGSSEANSPAADSPSAADYDPMQDMLDDRDRAAKKTQNADLPSESYQETDPNALSTLPAEKVVPVKKQKKELDMFASDDEEDDAEDAEEENETVKGTVLDEKMLDNWDDPEGYYKLISNELVNNGRYRMIRNLGRGVFANVAQAEDTAAKIGVANHKLVAIKMIRKNELMRRASQKEMEFLRKVNEADPQGCKHIVRLLGSFDHKGHLCIVFEHMSKNLRDLLKEETNGHGLALSAVRVYARQMFQGLQHLVNCQVIHLDLKPDNVLVSTDKKTIKLADFGTAVDKRDIIERTEYLVSRFYRAPEIILGMDISYPVDMWAIGCTVYELWTGKILFTGRSNNQMVKAFMDCLGWPSEKLLRKGLANNILTHFEFGSALKFISREVDKQDQHVVRKIEQQKKVNRDIKSRVHEAARGIATTDSPRVAELNELTDLLNSCLHMNVEKRITPKEALNHTFFKLKDGPQLPKVPKIPTKPLRNIPPTIRR
ncbi:kinase-like domain-containing protein [Phaeosphaeriaceae sp. PMI808]|nr:kinase-like domain-containing protein [Phaeosphaeriaceae sp. PMI808]